MKIGPATLHFFNELNNILVEDFHGIEHDAYQNHFYFNSVAVTKTAEKVSDCKNAIILGIGPGNDIDLEDLANRFDKITVVDVVLTHTQTAIDQLPEELRSKFILRQEDLTNVTAKIEDAAKSLFNNRHPSYEEFTEIMLEATYNALNEERSFPEEKFSFVCSSMICSQLMLGLHNFLDALSLEAYQKPFPEASFHQASVNHINHLYHLVHPSGKIYFSDHFVAENGCSYRLRGSLDVEEKIDELFAIENTASWDWELEDTKFEVTAMILSPKE